MSIGDEYKISKDIDQYIGGFPKDVAALLRQVRKIIRDAAPQARKAIQYAMPAFEFQGALVCFAGYRQHIGFYATPTGHAAFQKELSVYKTGKGSVQFPLDQPLPVALITKIVKFRIKENLAKVEGLKKRLGSSKEDG